MQRIPWRVLMWRAEKYFKTEKMWRKKNGLWGIPEAAFLEEGVWRDVICVPRQNPYFCLKYLKIKTLWEVESDLYPCCTPILYGCLDRQYFVNGLLSIKKTLDSSNRSYILVITELTTPLTFMRNQVRLFCFLIQSKSIKIKKEVHKTGSLFCGYWKRDIWK